jgi:hypothetical protein
LRKELLPILDRIDAVDEKYLIADCTSAFRGSVSRKQEEEESGTLGVPPHGSGITLRV